MNPDDEKRGPAAPGNGATGPAGVRPTREKPAAAADLGDEWGDAVSGPLEAYGASEDEETPGSEEEEEDAAGELEALDAQSDADDQDGADVHDDAPAAGLSVGSAEEAATTDAASSSTAEHELTAEQEVAEEHAEKRAAPPTPPMLPPRRDPNQQPTPSEAEQRQARKHQGAPAFIALEKVLEDGTFQLRDVGDLHKLATDLARLGQLFPIDVRLKAPDHFQIITGFRRVAALRFLKRDRVLARLHTDLSDEDALLMALAAAIHSEPVSSEKLAETRDRLEQEGRMTPAVRDMLDKALATDDGLAPENVEEEIDADELADDVTLRLGEINQDLALLAEVFGQLDSEKKSELLKQLAYSAELVAYLEGR